MILFDEELPFILSFCVLYDFCLTFFGLRVPHETHLPWFASFDTSLVNHTRRCDLFSFEHNTVSSPSVVSVKKNEP